MTNFTDDPEKIGRNSNRRRSRNMADAGNKDPQNQDPVEDHQGPQEDETGDDGRTAPTEMYLPDLDNTPPSHTLRKGLDWGMEDEVMVECPKLKQYFRLDTLVVQRTSGRVRLHTKDEDETFPISCLRTKFPIPLLKKALEGAEQQRATPKDLPGEDWPWKIKTILRRIVKVNSWIKTLQDAMDHAVKIDQESRQSKVMRTRRNDRSEIIDTTVNETSDIDINYVASRQGDSRFNSTMKPGYQRERKDFSPRNRQNDSFRNNRSWNSPRIDNQNFRKINKYKHHAREPRNNIKFEYSISRGEKEIMRTLRNMIDFLKGKTDKVIEDIKRMPKVNLRGVNEVSEDSIATISIEEIQRILKEDVNTVYDALVVSDYIEEIAEA